MEDFKLILYILAIVAYFIYTAWRRAFKTPDDDGRPPAPQEQPPRERPVAQGQPPRERPMPKPVPNQQLPRERPMPSPMPTQQSQPRQQQRPSGPATSFEDILREMQTKMERANEKNRTPVEKPEPVLQPPVMQPVARERASMRALSLEDPEQARLYNQKRKERIAAADALYEQKKLQRRAVPNVYGELLHNPQSVRQAFILSEIFNRKQY